MDIKIDSADLDAMLAKLRAMSSEEIRAKLESFSGASMGEKLGLASVEALLHSDISEDWGAFELHDHDFLYDRDVNRALEYSLSAFEYDGRYEADAANDDYFPLAA